MKLCDRAVEFVQIINEDGAIRQCGWLRNSQRYLSGLDKEVLVMDFGGVGQTKCLITI